MKKIFIISLSAFLFACNNGNKDAVVQATPAEKATVNDNSSTPQAASPYTNTIISVEGKNLSLSGSILVDKDKKKLMAGAPYRGMITTSSGPDNEGAILRFVFDTKPGTYPLTGMSFGRGKDANSQQFGGILGGEEKIYDSKVILTECKDLGENSGGGHKWSISGTIENLTIPALGIMLIDKEKNHPTAIKLDKIAFTDITFDDNAEEMLQKAMDELKKRNKK
jgi:hypothetical protein